MFRLQAYLGRCMASVWVGLRSERRVEVAAAGTATAAIGRRSNRRERAGARGSRRVALAAIAATVAIVTLAWGAAASLAADYQDKSHNVCEGTFTAGGCSSWGSHVTGFDNVAFGDLMMPALTGGHDDVASGFGALTSNTTGHDNLASGTDALLFNTTGIQNLAYGTDALV